MAVIALEMVANAELQEVGEQYGPSTFVPRSNDAQDAVEYEG